MGKTLDLRVYERMYSVTLARAGEPLLELPLTGLAEPEGAARLVRVYAPEIKASTYDVAATYFASWAGRLFAACLYAMWHDGVKLDAGLGHITLQMEKGPQGIALAFRFASMHAEAVPEARFGQEEFLLHAMEELIAGTIRPLADAIAAAGGVSPGIMWALMATGLHHIQRAWKAQASDADAPQQERMELVTSLLRERVRPEVFGQTRNPFQIKLRMVDSRDGAGEKIPVRAACCLAYKTDTDHGYCFSCPKLSEEERQAKRWAAAAARGG